MLNAKIKDEDVGYKNIELVNPKKRIAARGIVLDGNKIAIFHKKNMNEFKLPGGGVESNEDLEEAFKREVLEETGCHVKIITKLGITEEFKGRTNFYQLSHVFLSQVTNNTFCLKMTEKEKAEGGELLWVTLEDAIKMVQSCFAHLKPSPFDKNETLYSTSFIVKRDLKILEYYKSVSKKG